MNMTLGENEFSITLALWFECNSGILRLLRSSMSLLQTLEEPVYNSVNRFHGELGNVDAR